MDNRIDIWISEAEEVWLEMVHKHTKELFSGTFLPSHDHTHHCRVWNICKNLLRSIASFNPYMDQALVEGVLIAAYFHDLGMIRSTREDHGMLGREICETYFEESAMELPSKLDEILDAIEYHDIKGREISTGFQPAVSPGILDILTVADDLEAMGVIGIYRYTEIYLKRKIDLKELGVRILGNASARYKSIVESCMNCPALISEYRPQYELLISFFDSYNQQLLVHPPTRNVFYGHLGVVNFIRTLSVEGKTEPEVFLEKIDTNKAGSIVKEYFTALKSKLVKEHL